MNKFDELLYESGLTAQGCWDQMDSYDQEAILKFARLTIRECVNVIQTQERIPAGFLYSKNAGILEEAINHHFGIGHHV